MLKKGNVVAKISGAIARDKGAVFSHRELIQIAEIINTNAGAARAHAEMLHALIERSPTHASYVAH